MKNEKYTLGFNPAYDYQTKTFKSFKSWYTAVAFAQANKIKGWTIVKVGDHYEIH